MWTIYVFAYAIPIASWWVLALNIPEYQRPLVNVAGCVLLALGSFTAVIAKSTPVFTGRHEGEHHTKWRGIVGVLSYFIALVGAVLVLVAAVLDPAFKESWSAFVQGLGLLFGLVP